MLIRDPDEAVEVLRDIRQMGIHIAHDDFGTGFSSLSYLKAIPINAGKIDKSLVRDLSVDPDDEAILSQPIETECLMRGRP